MQTNIKQTFGVTLIEAVVVTAIMAFFTMSVMAYGNNQAARKEREHFYGDVEKVMMALREARNDALAAGSIQDTKDPFGVLMQKQSDGALTVQIFRDKNGNYQYDNFDVDRGEEQVFPTKYEITLMATPLAESSEEESTETLAFFFTAPNSEMRINNNVDTEYKSVEIALELDESLARVICLHRISRFIEPLAGTSCE